MKVSNLPNYFKRNSEDIESDKELFHLSWPIFVEFLLRFGCSSVNIFMISGVSALAVAAVGTVNQMLIASQFLYGFVTIGAQILVAQFLGAKLNHKIPTIIMTALVGALGIGLIIAFSFVFFDSQIMSFLQVPDDVMPYAVSYLKISGFGIIWMSLYSVVVAVLRAHGKTKLGLRIPLIALILEVILNNLFIYQPFGIPNFGVAGLGYSFNISGIIAFLYGVYLLHKNIGLTIMKNAGYSNKALIKVLKFGIPSSGESLSYQVSQIAINVIVAILGTQSLIAKNYIIAIIQFTCLVALSTALGTQIQAAKGTGENRKEYVNRRVLRSLIIAFTGSITVASLLALAGPTIAHILTDDITVQKMIIDILIIEIGVEIGRATCMIFVNALNAVGDVNFPIGISLVSVWLFCLPLAYAFSIVLHFGLIGVFLAYMCDECFRGLLLFARWKSGVWRNKVKY